MVAPVLLRRVGALSQRSRGAASLSSQPTSSTSSASPFRYQLPPPNTSPHTFSWYGLRHPHLLDTFGIQAPFQYKDGRPAVMLRPADLTVATALLRAHRGQAQQGRNNIILDGAAGTGKSTSLAVAAEWAKQNDWDVLTVPLDVTYKLARGIESWQKMDNGNYAAKRESMDLVKHWQQEASGALRSAPLPFTPSDELLAQLKTRVLEADKEKKVATIGDVMRLGTSHRNNAPAALTILCQSLPQLQGVEDVKGILVALDGVNYLHPTVSSTYLLEREDNFQDPMLMGELQAAVDLLSLASSQFKQGLFVGAISRFHSGEPEFLRIFGKSHFPGNKVVKIGMLSWGQANSVVFRMTGLRSVRDSQEAALKGASEEAGDLEEEGGDMNSSPEGERDEKEGKNAAGRQGGPQEDLDREGEDGDEDDEEEQEADDDDDDDDDEKELSPASRDTSARRLFLSSNTIQILTNRNFRELVRVSSLL